MAHKNLFAFTAPGGSYPPYISINRRDDGMVSVEVRSAPLPPLHSGVQAEIVLSPEEFERLRRELSEV